MSGSSKPGVSAADVGGGFDGSKGVLDGGLPCTLCGSHRSGDGALLYLAHGITIWLCDAHRRTAYLTRERGMVFARRLARAWAASGSLNGNRLKALRSHLRNVDGAVVARDRPGSYAWRRLRQEAERRFAGGEPPRTVIRELRHRHRHDPAQAPSIRTMRRWFNEQRWLADGPPDQMRRRARTHRPAPRKPRPRILQMIDALPPWMALGAFSPWYLPPRSHPSRAGP